MNKDKTQNGFLSAGRIIGAHGISGEIKVHPYIDTDIDPNTKSIPVFKAGNNILLRDATGGEETRKIVTCRLHKKTILLLLEGVVSRNDAEALNQVEIIIKRSALPDLKEGEYYWSDIIGLDVFCVDETYLGIVESIIQTGSNDVYTVKNKETGREVLVPAIHTVITEIDMEKSIMRVDLPEGL